MSKDWKETLKKIHNDYNEYSKGRKYDFMLDLLCHRLSYSLGSPCDLSDIISCITKDVDHYDNKEDYGFISFSTYCSLIGRELDILLDYERDDEGRKIDENDQVVVDYLLGRENPILNKNSSFLMELALTDGNEKN